MVHKPSDLPRGLLNPILTDKETYENVALWIFHVLKDPEQMEIINHATQEQEQSEQGARIDYPITPMRQEVPLWELNSPMLSLYQKAEKAQINGSVGQLQYDGQH